LPWPAASIITPMMLFAFTLRPLREIQISHWKLLARCVSFAAARACRPSLLMIAASSLGIAAAILIHVHHAVRSTRFRALNGGGKRAVAAGEHAQQHRQRDARHTLDVAVLQQARAHVAG